MEEPICLLDTPGLRIQHDVANQWIYNQWLGEHTTDSVRYYGELVYECLQKHPCPKVLSDHSLLTGDWSLVVPGCRHFFERMADLGVAYFAWVYSPCYNDRVAMEKALLHIVRPTAASFDDICSAYEWLRRKPVRPPVVFCAEPL
jgi:hypothetical protein